MPHCFSKWCAALLHLFGACALLFPWAQVLLLLLQHFFLDGGVLDLVFAFCWFRSIGPAVPAAPLFFEIVCCNIARPWCLRLVSVVPALPVFRSSMLLVVLAYGCMFHSVSPYMTTSTCDVLLRNASLVLCVFFFTCPYNFKSVRRPWLATEGITGAWSVVVCDTFSGGTESWRSFLGPCPVIYLSIYRSTRSVNPNDRSGSFPQF